MSWIGGLNDSFNQISNITGQIGGQLSTFTKEVLAEGTDEDLDYEAEVRRLRMKLIEAEAYINEKEAEISKHVQSNSVLQEKARTASLEASSLSHEYEAKLQQQQKIINKLKQGRNTSEDGFQILNDDDFHPNPSSSSRRTFSGGSTDAAEFDDVISSQREVNRLSYELSRVKEECEHWKQQANSQSDVIPLDDNQVILQNKVKELEGKLKQEIERHQHELFSLQESNSTSLRQYKEEIYRLRSLGGSETQSHDNINQSQKVTSLNAELEELKSKLRTRDRQLQVQKSNIDILKSQVDEQKSHSEILESSLKDSVSEVEALQKECNYLETVAKKHQEELKKTLQDIRQSVLPDKDEHMSENPAPLSAADIAQKIKLLKENNDKLQVEVESLKHDNDVTKDTKPRKLERSFSDEKKGPQSRQTSAIPRPIFKPLYQSSPQSKMREDNDEKFLLVADDNGHHDNGDEEVSAVAGDLTMTLAALQKQVEDYELEIAQYELVQREWQTEKESLQNMLDRYQDELGHKSNTEKVDKASDTADVRAKAVVDLKRELEEVKEARLNLEKDRQKIMQEKEQLQTAALNLEEELNMSIAEAQTEKDKVTELESDLEQALAEKKRLETALKNVSDDLNSSKLEKSDLDQAIEMLDSQHQDEMNQIIVMRNELNEKLKSTQAQLEAAKNDNLTLERTVASLREELKLLNEQKITKQDEEVSQNISEELQMKNLEKRKAEEDLVDARNVIAELQKASNQGREELHNIQKELQTIQCEKKDAEDHLKEARDEILKLQKNSSMQEEILRIQDKLQVVNSEKLSIVKELQDAKNHITELEKSLAQEKEETLDAETEAEDLKEKLSQALQENEDAAAKLAEVERENIHLMEMLQQQAQENLEAITDAEARVDEVESRRRKMEEEQKMTLTKMEHLKTQHLKVIRDMDSFRQSQLESEDQFVASLEAKEEEVKTLKEELDLLQQEEKKRMVEMSHVHENDVEHEALLKNEIRRLEDRLTSVNEERSLLKTEIATVERKVADLQKDITTKDSVIVELQTQMSDIKSESSSELNTTISNFKKQIEDLKANFEHNLQETKEKHAEEVHNHQQDFNSKIAQLQNEHEEQLSALEKEKELLEGIKVQLDARVTSLEHEKASTMQVMNEKMQKSTDREAGEINNLRNRNEEVERRLYEELELRSLEAEKHQQELKSLENKLTFLQNNLDETKTQFTKEKKDIMEKHAKEQDEFNKKIKANEEESKTMHLEKVKALKEEFRDELSKALADANFTNQEHIEVLKKDIVGLQEERSLSEEKLASAKNQLKSLEEELKTKEVEWKRKLKEVEEELEASQNDVVLMSEHLDQEKRNWKKEMTLAVEKMRADHKIEVDELKKMQLQNTKDPESVLDATAVKNRNQHLEEEVARLEDDLQRTSIDNDMKKVYEDKILALESEIGKLRISVANSVSKESVSPEDVDKMLQEIRKRDLSGWEKGDLSKEDIGSLLAVIKERDQVINMLRATSQVTPSVPLQKANADLEEKYRQLNEERDQILAVISQKTQENRQLKDENQRMVDTISAGQTELAEIQAENRALKEKYEGFDLEMTKETVGRLSKLISEKDLEIESLKQKCQTLLDVLHQQEQAGSPAGGSGEPSVSSQQVQLLLRDRETLSQQVRQLLTERDHLVALVNTKHQEALLFQEEARKASEATEKDAAENSKLQISYGNLVHDYEQIEMKLNTVQRELGRFKEAFNHLEETKEILFSKLEIPQEEHPTPTLAPPQFSHSSSSQASAAIENLRSDANRGAEKTNDELEMILEKKTESLLQKDLLLQESMKKREDLEDKITQLQKDLKEKDILIHWKMEEMTRTGNDLSQKSNEVEILRKSVGNLREQVTSCTYEANLLREKVMSLERASEEKESESTAFQETNAQLSILLKEREYEMEAMKEKVSSVSEILQRNEQGKDSETRKYLQELDRLKKETTSVKHERDQIMLTLKQKQLEAQRANEEARSLREKESKLQSELTRLRGHLVQVEETYTQEAVLASDREQAVRKQLEQIQNRTASVQEASEQSKQQVESLQEQLRGMGAQRDKAVQNFQLSQEQSSQYAAALQQLQLAAERMQREEASMYAARVDKINQQLKAKEKETMELNKIVSNLKAKLEDVNEALESASRLNEQLELKEQTIDRLKEIVSEKQLNLEELQDRLHSSNARNETMVDKELVKNLLVGYFGSPANKQPDVLRLISSVIGFSQEEINKLERPKASWVGGWIPWGKGGSPSPKQPHHSPSDHADLNESFSQMFVKFLENESSKQPIARLPATAMVNEAQQRMSQRKIASEGIPTPAFNPPAGGSKEPPARSTVAGRYNPFITPSTAATATTGTPSSGTTSHPLMQPLTPILPTFAPMAGVKPTAERDLLQGILHSDSPS
uniref:Thyroid receptor-interacting protein 11 n=1 Tax=Phallusia mammillata TaxID=59560 RepID=A0A6F9DVQ1_9ASCI|nr:thyroid receptor-interacting protein 11 [Phallusia mammillata]